MKTITITKNIYRYDELSDKAQDAVKEWLLQGRQETDVFSENCENDLESLFPYSDLDVQYSLSYCQGDGFNIVGKLDFRDMLPHMKGKKTSFLSEFLPIYSDKEIKTLKWLFEWIECEYIFSRSRFNGSCYSCKDQDKSEIEYLVDEAMETLEYYHFKNIGNIPKLLKRFYYDAFDCFEKLDKFYEDSGYAYFYEIDEETAQEVCEINDYMFFEDGSVYCKVYSW